jgi:type 1 glutamine amidotransferase
MDRTRRAPRRRSLLVATAVAAVAVATPVAASTPGTPPAVKAEVPRVLVWGGAYGYRHSSITSGELAFTQLGQETGAFTTRVTENPADLTMSVLKDVDVLVWISTTGKPPITQQQRDDIIRWSSCGGGNLGFHAALDSDYGWAEHAELFGAQFDSHPKGAGSGEARMLVEDHASPITAGWKGKSSFMLDDEYYRWRTAKRIPDVSLPRNAADTHVLLSLDETTVGGDIQKGGLAYEHHQPIAWTKTFRNKGRVYYNNMGHSDSTWSDPAFRTSLVNGVGWVSKVRPDATCLAGTGSVASKPKPPAAPAAKIGRTCPLPALRPRGGGTWETSGAARSLTEKGDSVALNAGIPGGLGWGAQHWVLDLSRTRAAKADVNVTLTRPTPTDDYDLSETTPCGFYGSHELPGVTTEKLVLKDVPHCGLLQAYGDNMYAASFQGPTLSATVAPAGSRRTTLTPSKNWSAP